MYRGIRSTVECRMLMEVSNKCTYYLIIPVLPSNRKFPIYIYTALSKNFPIYIAWVILPCT